MTLKLDFISFMLKPFNLSTVDRQRASKADSRLEICEYAFPEPFVHHVSLHVLFLPAGSAGKEVP